MAPDLFLWGALKARVSQTIPETSEKKILKGNATISQEDYRRRHLT